MSYGACIFIIVGQTLNNRLNLLLTPNFLRVNSRTNSSLPTHLYNHLLLNAENSLLSG